MSSDLLAEFDSFYKAPPAGTATKTNSSNPSKVPAPANFSFFDPPSTAANVPQPTQSQWTTPASTNDNIWGDFNTLQIGKPTEATIPLVVDPWGDFNALQIGKSTEATAAAAVDPWGDFNALQIGTSTETTAPAAADPWGSFETSEQSVPASSGFSNSSHLSSGFGATKATKPQPSKDMPRTRIERSSTLDMFSGKIPASVLKSQPSQPTQYSAYQIPDITQEPDIKPGDILFDADEEYAEDDDDDFGDFETVTEAPPAPVADLLSLHSPPKAKVQKKPEPVITKSSSLVVNQFPYPQAPKSPSFQQRNPFEQLAIKTPTTATPEMFDDVLKRQDSPVTAWPTYESKSKALKSTPYMDSPAIQEPEDDDWGDFADLPPDPPSAIPTAGIEADAWAWDSVDNAKSVKSTEHNTAPPTNIPPPSVLMGLFPQLLNLLQSGLFKPVSTHDPSIKNRILSDPTAINFLRSYLAIVAVCAHVIAGRKLRWKRDTILAQAMKIGPSAAGGKGGMKLTGVDKAEITREEREAADVIRIWQEQVGRLRTTIVIANANLPNKGEHLVVPEISANMAVKTATMAEGGLAAPKSCVLCGLKREERVAKVDVTVEDSFGEWWIEHWGHRGCRNFWEEHEGKMRGR